MENTEFVHDVEFQCPTCGDLHQITLSIVSDGTITDVEVLKKEEDELDF